MAKYFFCDRKKELIKEWKRVFSSYNNVEIKLGGFFEARCQAVVSPANSFGEMGGGLDYYLSIFFDEKTPKVSEELGINLQTALLDFNLAKEFYSRLDWTIEKKVKNEIREKFNGELPVGKAILVETDSELIPYLIVAPTMRIPENITGTDNAYRAMKAIIRIVEENSIESILIPGLGAGVGGLSAKDCAEQMKKAFSKNQTK